MSWTSLAFRSTPTILYTTLHGRWSEPLRTLRILHRKPMLKIVINLSKFQFKSTFRTWAYRIVVNHFLNAEKKKNEFVFKHFEGMAHALQSQPNHEMTELKQQESQDLIREMNLSCMSGMLLCLNRQQRLIYIIGEVFEGDHTIGSEVMEISKDNFRAKLSKARKDLYHFMNNQCGLVNKANPCRCYKKVKVAVENQVINAKDLLFNREEYATFRSHISEDAAFMWQEADRAYTELFQGMTFKENFDKQSFIRNILNDSNWKSRLNLS